MMWCTKVIGLVALVASVFCNAEELDSEESNTRQARGQDHFESVTLSGDVGPKSSLFGACLRATRTLEVSLFSIEMPGTKDEFIRHVPDSYERRFPEEWERVTKNPKVSNFLECAAAAHEQKKPMFKYNGGDDCKASSRTYGFQYVSACETAEQEAVYILNAPASCPMPDSPININVVTKSLSCIGYNTDLAIKAEAQNWCYNKGLKFFAQTLTLPYSTIVDFLKGLEAKGLKVSSYDFFTDTHQNMGAWFWDTRAARPIDPALLPTSTFDATTILIIKGSANFSLQYASADVKAASFCVEEGLPL